MGSRRVLLRLLVALLVVGACGAPFVVGAPRAAEAATTQAVRIELAGDSAASLDPSLNVGNIPFADYFRRWRRGPLFRYSFTELPNGSGPYWVKLSLSEVCPRAGTMDVRWGSSDAAVTATVVSSYSICTSPTAKVSTSGVRTDVIGPVLVTPTSNQLHLEFRGNGGDAVVSTIELASGSSTSIFLTVPADQSRHRQNLLARAKGAGDASFEAVLGRLGGRYDLDLAAQRLAFRSSPLGTWADDLSDLVVAVRTSSGQTRVLPLTDRYPVFSQVDQSLSLTSVHYVASDAATGLALQATFRAPFYPQDEATSLPPAFLVDLAVTAPSEVTVTIARPVPYDITDTACVGCAPQPLVSPPGVRWGTVATFGDQSRSLSSSEGQRADEALALLSASGGAVMVQSTATGDCGSFLPCFSPAPDGNSYVFRGRPRGWVGLQWRVGGPTGTARLVMAGMTSGETAAGTVLHVDRPPSLSAQYAFLYRTSLGLTTVADVVSLAASQADAWSSRSDAFDNALGPASFDLGDAATTSSARNVLAVALQSYLVNTWWGDRVAGIGPDQWYSVWEGTCCFFHSTLDVAYNDAQVLLSLWPELLGKQLDEWPSFTKTDPATFESYPMHDMGSYTFVEGQAYPYDMPVEESANYVLLLYAYWRATGDATRVSRLWTATRSFARYLATADTTGNGLPDRGTNNTIDQGSAAVASSRDQVYLGVKSASAAQAMLEMAKAAPGATDLPETERSNLALLRHKVDQTLALRAWRTDHLATTLDQSVAQADRDAASIYGENGLLYLLEFGGNLPVGSDTVARLRTDLSTATGATMGPSGSVHTSVGNNNAWFSQNTWRDDVALYLGATWSGGSFLSLVQRYWNQQLDFAQRLDGAWWDVVVYGGSVFLPSTPSVQAAAVDSGAGSGAGSDGAHSASATDYKAAAATGYGQSLGYYPRGAAFFGLLPSALGVSLNRPDGVLGTVGPARPGVKAPLLSLATWGTGPPVSPPVGAWSSAGTFSVTPAAALPPVPRAASAPSIQVPSSFSPNNDGAGDVLEGSATVSPPSRLSASFATADGVRASTLPGSTFSWDGTLPLLGVVGQGVTRACVTADDPDPRSLRTGACSTVYVNDTIPEPSRTWFLAEGSTLYGFEEFILVQNPGDADATVEVTYQTPGGPTGREPLFVPARSRRTIRANDDIASDISTRLDSDVPVVVERAMYITLPDGTRREGHAALGVTAPEPTWYLAEGSTQYGFDQYVLVQNPQSSPAQVTFTFSVEGGSPLSRAVTVPAASRYTLYVNDVLTGDISTRVDASVPVIVERAMYWGGPNRRNGATADTGVPLASKDWYLAEGTTGFGFDEYVLLQNPNDGPATVAITYDLLSGPVPRPPLVLPPRSRTTLHLNDEVDSQDVSTRLTSDLPVIAERAMYFGGPPGGGATSASGGHVSHGTPTPSSLWHVAEGTTAWGFDEYVLLENPGSSPAVVTLLSQPDTAEPSSTVVEVGAGSRVTIYANDVWPDQDLSLLVTSTSPIVVERSMYFGGPSRRLGGTGTVVAR